jgi:hypothetical protein
MAVSFTQGNDFIVPTEDGQTYQGLGGNDTYMLSAATVAENATIVITDTEGDNNIQLVGGLEITSSLVTSNALELTLSNGAKVQILGADTFGYDVGGNALAGTTGTPQTFTELVEDTLGTTVPAEGEDPSEGGEVEVPGPTPEPEGAVFTVSDAGDVDEGGTATFTVSLGQAQAEETTVDYAVTLEGDASADDHGPITVDGVEDSPATGTLTFAAGQTMKVITIPVIADTVSPEDGEGITVTLSNPTGADVELGDTVASTVMINDVPVTYTLTQDSEDVQEGEAITYTVTASAAATEDIDVAFSVSPGDPEAADQGTNNTNLNDFSQGAFNPTTVTMPAGETEVQFTLNTENDGITELPEDYSVVAEIDGEVIGEITSTLLDSEGTGEDDAITLTTDADNPDLTTGDDILNGILDGAGNETTWNLVDDISSPGGTNTFNVQAFNDADDISAGGVAGKATFAGRVTEGIQEFYVRHTDSNTDEEGTLEIDASALVKKQI